MIEVRTPGMLTTVQDLGRPGRARFGVATGGALDRAALILGNRLLGNDPGEAALELTLIGPTLVFTEPTVFALAGADLGGRLNGAAFPIWEPIAARPGDELSFAPPKEAAGARCYLCIAGGIAVEPVMESRATDLIGGFGGVDGRALRAGDRLPIGPAPLPTEAILARQLSENPPPVVRGIAARVVLGPQQDRFTEAGLQTLLTSTFQVSAKSNRQGLRLNGPVIAHTRGADMISEGIAHGAIQVPGDGLPIVLLGARQTVGGYTKIATVIGADLDRFGQARPGDDIRFVSVSVEEARREMLAYRAWLDGIGVIERASVFGGATLTDEMGMPKEIAAVAGSWDPDGVVRVIEALARSGATSFAIEVASAGLKLEVRREGDAPSPLPRPPEAAMPEERTTSVTAPVLGVLYRRAAPDQPVLIEEGGSVEAGQTICVIEVMKTYHEVTAPRAGQLIAFLVAEGQFVEYGQAIAEIA